MWGSPRQCGAKLGRLTQIERHGCGAFVSPHPTSRAFSPARAQMIRRQIDLESPLFGCSTTGRLGVRAER
jgi:hypothetical protein